MGIWFDYTWILKKRQWSNKRKLWKSGRKLTKSGLLSSDPFCQYFWWFLSIFVLILVLLVLVLFVLISVLLVWVGLPMPVVFSGVQETVIQSRRVGVTKIASRWGRGASLLPYIGGPPSDTEPSKTLVGYYVNIEHIEPSQTLLGVEVACHTHWGGASYQRNSTPLSGLPISWCIWRR